MMKIPPNTNSYLAIVGLMGSLSINVFSIYNMTKNISPTLFTLTFVYSLFFTFGFIYHLLEGIIKHEEVNANNFFNSNSNEFNKYVHVSFYVVIILILIILSESLYTKPLSYYLLTAIATVLIGYQIASKRDSDINNDRTILLQIISLATIIRVSSFLINPYLIGPDVPWHFHFIQKIVETGYLNPMAHHYYFYPSYHLIQSLSGIILDFSENVFNLVNLITSIVSTIIVYLIGKKVFNNSKAGLMCSLLLTISTMHIFLVTYNTSKIGGTTLFFLCFFFLIKMHKSPNVKIIILFWMSAFTTFMWHPEIAIALMILLGGASIVEIFIERKFKLNTTFILYLVAYVAHMLYINSDFFTTIVQNIFIDRAQPTLIQDLAGQTINMPLILQLSMAYLGIALLAFCVPYSALKLFNKFNYAIFFSNVTLVFLYMLPLLGILSGNFGANPERTLTYTSSLVLIIAGGSIFEIFKFRTKTSVALFVIVLLIFSFFSISSYIVGDGNKVFNDNIPKGTIFTTHSNIVSYNFLIRIPFDSTIISDYETIRYTSDKLRGFFDLPRRHIVRFPSLITNGYFVINTPNLERLNWRYGSWGKEVSKTISKGDLIYNNGDLSIYNI